MVIQKPIAEYANLSLNFGLNGITQNEKTLYKSPTTTG
jgi:hypothetical protein